MTMFPIVELSMWVVSMLTVTVFAFMLSKKLHNMQPDSASMPKTNATEASRLFLIFGLNYLVITFGCIFLFMATAPSAVFIITETLKEWWLVEISVFFNIITTYCLYTALNRVIVNV